MSVKLYEHNQEPYNNAKEIYKKSNICCVINPTGTGKMFIALKLIEDTICNNSVNEIEGNNLNTTNAKFNDKKVLYLAPYNSILHQAGEEAKKAGIYSTKNITRMTYQKLASLSKEERAKLKYDAIVLDEFHHCGSPIWGEAVSELIENNKEAKVLGLSATPIRYFDGNIDMAEQLFKGNIASEMTFEEAVERGILPEFDYIIATYGVESELEKLKQEIDEYGKIDKEKSDEAKVLYEQLKVKLGENVTNLQDILEKYMVEKDGKYIVFCKDIEDMENKIAEAEKLFSKVNSNMSIFKVSSAESIKQNNKTLTEFKKKSEDGKLKLLFSVDMINEGYNLPDIAGVVMFRPTKSPTVYRQQMGRALRAGGKKKVIIDLVDNFESVKLIEGVVNGIRREAERKGISGSDLKEQKVRVFDETRGVSDIVDKIKALTIERAEVVSIEKKLELFNAFYEQQKNEGIINSPEELKDIIKGSTVFEYDLGKGVIQYPIGQYAIQLRNQIFNNKATYNSEIVNEISKYGILNRQFESTIEEKVEYLEQFARKYPILINYISKTTGINIKEKRLEYLGYKDSKESIEKFNKYYQYIAQRIRVNKLSPEHFERLREAGVGGIFGYSTAIENVLSQYENEPEETKKFIVEMLRKYGTMEEFKNHYVEELTFNTYFPNESSIFLQGIDISSPNFCITNEGWVRLVKDLRLEPIRNTHIPIINSAELSKALNDMPDKYKEIINLKYGIDGSAPLKDREVAEKLGFTSQQYFSQLKAKALRILSVTLERKFDSDLYGKRRIGDYYEFLTDFISEYGIFKRDNISDEERTKIINILHKSYETKIRLDNGEKLVDEYADNDTKREMLKNEFGEYLEYNSIKLHFFNGDLARSDVKIPINEILHSHYTNTYNSAIKTAILSDKNKDIMTQLQHKKDIGDKFKMMPIDFAISDEGLIDKIDGHTLFDVVQKSRDKILKAYISGYEKDEINEKIEEMLRKKGLHLEMTYDEMEAFLSKQNEISDIQIDKTGNIVLGILGIKNLNDFRNTSYSDIMAVGKTITSEIDEKIEALNTDKKTEYGNIKIEDLDLSIRAYNILKKSGIKDVKDIVEHTKEEIRMLGGMGYKTFDEIRNKISSMGLLFKETDENNKKNIYAEYNVYTHQKVSDLGVSEEIVKLLNSMGIKNAKDYLQNKDKIMQIGGNTYFKVVQLCNTIGVESSLPMNTESKDYIKFQRIMAEKMQIEDLDLSVRAYNCLVRAGINSVKDILSKDEESLAKIRNLGYKCYNEVIDKIKSLGFSFDLMKYGFVEENISEENGTKSKTESNSITKTDAEEDDVDMTLGNKISEVKYSYEELKSKNQVLQGLTTKKANEEQDDIEN